MVLFDFDVNFSSGGDNYISKSGIKTYSTRDARSFTLSNVATKNCLAVVTGFIVNGQSSYYACYHNVTVKINDAVVDTRRYVDNGIGLMWQGNVNAGDTITVICDSSTSPRNNQYLSYPTYIVGNQLLCV